MLAQRSPLGGLRYFNFLPKGAITMFKKVFTAFIVIAFLLSISGCISTLADARAAKGSGVSRTYSATQEVVWKAVPSVLADLDLQFVSENKKEGYILAQHAGVPFVSYESNVAIFIESAGGVTKTRVEVVSKHIDSTQIFGSGWGNDILPPIISFWTSRIFVDVFIFRLETSPMPSDSTEPPPATCI